MSTTPSARIGLAYDSSDDGIDPQVPNFTRLDAVMPVLWVTDGTTPADADLYDGAIVGEITSGKVWVAKKNGGGTFDKRYVIYPYTLVGYTPAAAYSTGGGFANYGWSTFSFGKNSSSAQINGSNFWVAPIKGIYMLHAKCEWAASAAGVRQQQLMVNAVPDSITRSIVTGPAAADPAYTESSYTRALNAGDIIGQQLYQNSGGPLNVSPVLEATLLSPTW